MMKKFLLAAGFAAVSAGASAAVSISATPGLFSSEGGAFLGGYAMDKYHVLRMATGLSELWDGKPIRRVRAARWYLRSFRMYGSRRDLGRALGVLLGERMIDLFT